MTRARPLVVGCSAGTLVLGVISIFFILTAYTTYRSKDFVEATKTSNFAVKDTCVESVTDGIVADANFQDASWASNDCSSDKKIPRLLLSQVHSIYYLHKTAPSDEVSSVAVSLMASLLGSTSQSINVSMAANVMKMLDDDGFTVPAKCSSIYTGATSYPYDTVGVSTTPMLPTMSCDGALTGSNPGSFTAQEWGKLLYACEKTFMFGRTGPHPDTFGIPLLNEPPGPNIYLWPNTTGFNSTSPWSVKSRMFLGFRFGWSLWAYTPAILSLSYLTMDAALVLLTETTIKNRVDGMKRQATSSKNKLRFAVLFAAATYVRERGVRFIFASLLVINSVIWMTVTVWTPWGLWSPRLGRPYCDEGVDADVDPTFSYLFYKKTQGGWESEAPVTLLEFAAVCAQFFILVAIPIARSVPNSGAGDGKVGEGLSQYREASNKFEGWVAILQSARGGGVFILSTVVAIVLLIIGNAAAGSVFGNAWARAVADEAIPWNEVIIAEYIYDMNLGALVSIMAGGLILGVVVGRWMIDSFTCESLNIFFVWCIFAIGAFVPMFVVYGLNYFTDKDKHITDCGIFPEGGDYDLERNSCEARYWTVIVGTIILAAVVGFLTLLGLWDARHGLIKRPQRAKIGQGTWGTNMDDLGPLSGINTVAAGAAAQAGGDRHVSMVINGTETAGRYTSKDESFFNFRTDRKTAEDSKRALLSPSPPPSHTGALPVAAASGMRFTLNPAAITPANRR
jgi:hypothetical protein